jgi:hypothetical protein
MNKLEIFGSNFGFCCRTRDNLCNDCIYASACLNARSICFANISYPCKRFGKKFNEFVPRRVAIYHFTEQYSSVYDALYFSNCFVS